jgi:hypothetical protein
MDTVENHLSINHHGHWTAPHLLNSIIDTVENHLGMNHHGHWTAPHLLNSIMDTVENHLGMNHHGTGQHHTFSTALKILWKTI